MDRELRIEALRQAMAAHGDGATEEQVLETAEAFLGFLQGQTSKPKMSAREAFEDAID